MKKLSPVPIARYAVLSVIKGFDTVLRLGWAPILISTLAAMALEPSLMTVVPESGEVEIHFGPMLAFLAIGIVTQTIFAVAWHRNVAFGETRAGQRIYLRLGKREAVYAVVAFVVVCIMSLGLGALPVLASLMASGQAAVGTLLILGAPVMALFLLARLCLMLPMAALDHKVDPARSWQAAEGNSWRIVAVLLLVGIPIVVVELVLVSVFGGIIESALASFGALGEVVSFVARFVSGLVFLALLGVIVSAITLVYIILTGDETLKARLPAPLATFVEAG
jgi:hypothetical protein